MEVLEIFALCCATLDLLIFDCYDSHVYYQVEKLFQQKRKSFCINQLDAVYHQEYALTL